MYNLVCVCLKCHRERLQRKGRQFACVAYPFSLSSTSTKMVQDANSFESLATELVEYILTHLDGRSIAVSSSVRSAGPCC